MDQSSKDGSRKYSTGSPSPSPSVNLPTRDRMPIREGQDPLPKKPATHREANSHTLAGPGVRNNLISPGLSANTSEHGSSSKLLPVVTNLPEEREFFAAVKSQLVCRVGDKVRETESMLKGSFAKLEAREKEIIKHYESQLSTSRQITNHLVGLSCMVGIPVLARQLTRREEGLTALAQKHYIDRLLRKGISALEDYTMKRRDYKVQSEQNQLLATLSENYNQHIDTLEAEIAELKKEILRTKKEKMRFKDTVRAALESGFSLLENSGQKLEEQSEFEEENPRAVTPTEFIATSAYSSNIERHRHDADVGKFTEGKAPYNRDQHTPSQVGTDRKPTSTHSSQLEQSQHPSGSQGRYKRTQPLHK